MDLAADIARRLEALVAAPKPFACVYRYADGRERRVPMLSMRCAKNHLAGNLGRVGRDLIDRSTGETVRILTLTIEPN